jgi:hypothetical protein
MKAGEFSSVASRSFLLDLKQDCISIAINGDGNNFLEVARGLTLFPELIA